MICHLPFHRLALSALLLLSACGPQETVKPTPSASSVSAPAALSVQWVQPSWQARTEWLEAQGNVVAREVVSVTTEVAGLRIAQFHAEVGQVVPAGALLASLDDGLLRGEHQQQQASVAEARVGADQARQQLDRAKSLFAEGMVSLQALQNAQSADASAQARLRQSQAGLTSSQQRMSRTRLRASAAGLIIARSGVQGGVLAPGQEAFRLAKDGALDWVAEVPVEQAGKLAPGQPAQVEVGPQQILEVEIRRVDPVADALSRRVLVHVALPLGTSLRAGSFVKGRISLGEQPAFWLPGSAVVLRGEGAWVMVLDPHGLVHQQAVQLLQSQGTQMAVQGVDGAMRVVAQGAAYLAEGDRVNVLGPVSPAPTTAAEPQTPPHAAIPASSTVLRGALRGLSLEP